MRELTQFSLTQFSGDPVFGGQLRDTAEETFIGTLDAKAEALPASSPTNGFATDHRGRLQAQAEHHDRIGQVENANTSALTL